VLRDNLLLSFRKEPREAMLTIVKASAVLNLLIRRVCKKLYELDGLQVASRGIQVSGGELRYVCVRGVCGGCRVQWGEVLNDELSKKDSTHHGRDARVRQTHQCRLPWASETQALIGSEPVEDKGLQRKHDALCAHVENFSAVQMVTQSRVWLGDLVFTSTFANIEWTLISITLTLEDKVASLKSIGVRNILNDNNHLVVGSTGVYSLPDVQFVVERVYKDSASCDISLFMTTSVNNLQVVERNSCYPPDPRFGLSELVVVTNPQPPNKGFHQCAKSQR